MPTQLNVYKCNVCGGIFDHNITVVENNETVTLTPQQQAQRCEDSHPSTMSFARAAQSYVQYGVMPDSISISHGGKSYRYYIKK